jgi:hypothetical protein
MERDRFLRQMENFARHPELNQLLHNYLMETRIKQEKESLPVKEPECDHSEKDERSCPRCFPWLAITPPLLSAQQLEETNEGMEKELIFLNDPQRDWRLVPYDEEGRQITRIWQFYWARRVTFTNSRHKSTESLEGRLLFQGIVTVRCRHLPIQNAMFYMNNGCSRLLCHLSPSQVKDDRGVNYVVLS